MTQGFDAVVSGSGVPAAFVKFLKDEGIADAESVALLTSMESDLQRDVFDLAKAAGVDITAIKDKTAVKKLGIRCRKSLESGTMSVSYSARQKADEGIPKEAEKEIKSVRDRTLGFFSWLFNPRGQLQV